MKSDRRTGRAADDRRARQAGCAGSAGQRDRAAVAPPAAVAHDCRVPAFSLYVHIPYCDSKCPYCDFNSYAVKRWPERAYCDALIGEMTSYAGEAAWRNGVVQ